MKTMLFFCICLIVISTNSTAQNSFGIQGGATFANQKYSGGGYALSLKTKVGLTLGVVSSIGINKNFAFRPELNFTQKGAKASSSDAGGGSINLNYLELPLNFVYRMSKNNTGLFVGAGPSVGVGISGKIKSDGETDQKIKFGSGDDADFKSLDFGAGVIAGYQFIGGFFVSANYNFGLNNLAPGSNNGDGKARNNYFGLKIGLMFK